MHNAISAETKSPFLFDLDSEMWRINHERCGLIFGPAAAVLQIAHPRIAKGVAEHSDFRNDTLGRLRRTLAATNGIAFGTIAEAEALQRKLHAVHSQVQGETPEGMKGPSRYSAFEPGLLIWVLATLVMAAVKGWELVYGSLPADRRESFYQDMLRFGTYFGVREQDCPSDWHEFSKYYDEMIAGDELGSHPLCTEVCHHIVRPTASLGTRLLGHGLRFMVVETLPEPLREKLGLESNRKFTPANASPTEGSAGAVSPPAKKSTPLSRSHPPTENRTQPLNLMSHAVLTRTFKRTLLALVAVAVAVLGATFALPVRADLSDFTEIKVSDIEDVTLDATYRGLFFRADGKSYYYNHPVANQPVAIADFVDLLGKAQSLLVIESTNRRSTAYYDGRDAVELTRILLKFGNARNLND